MLLVFPSGKRFIEVLLASAWFNTILGLGSRVILGRGREEEMDVVIAAIISGLAVLPLVHWLGVSACVSLISSRLLALLAYVVILLVGLEAGGAIRSPLAALGVIVLSLAMAVVSVFSSLLAAVIITRTGRRHGGGRANSVVGAMGSSFTPTRVLVVLASGWLLGIMVSGRIRSVVEAFFSYLVAVLVFFAILSVSSEIETLRNSFRSIGLGLVFAAASMTVSGVSLLIFYPLTRINPRVLASIGVASGWYSLVGPLLAQINPVYGLLGFLSNVFRESMHILLYPLLSRRDLPLPGVIMGGATSMDTGLPVIAIHGDRESMITGMTQGIVITLTAPIVLSLLLY